MKPEKKEEPEIYHTPFGSTTIPPYPEIDLSPYTIETTTLGDSQRHFITTTNPGTFWTYTGSAGETRHVYYPPKHWEPYSTTLNYKDFMRKIGKEEEADVELFSDKSTDGTVHLVFCRNTQDLSIDKILTTLSAAKGKLMYDLVHFAIKEIQCKMTPLVKRHIIDAGKKLKMYGKEPPIIASFDEYGNRLPDHIEIGNDRGITVSVVDPKYYGEIYLELKAICPKEDSYKTISYQDYATSHSTILDGKYDTPFF